MAAFNRMPLSPGTLSNILVDMDSRPSSHGIIRLALAAASVLFLQSPVFSQTPQTALLNQYCVTCHSDKARTGGLSLQSANLADIPKGAEMWEKVIRKVRVGAMPPQGMPRPDKSALDGFASYLETSLDKSYAEHPNPGRASMHRLNRAEYANAVRDLLALNVDAAALLPADDEASGFDNNNCRMMRSSTRRHSARRITITTSLYARAN